MDMSLASTRRTCPVCAAHGWLEQKRGSVGHQPIEVGRCASCRLVYAHPRIAQDFRDVPAAFFQNDWASFDPGMVAYQYNRLIEAVRIKAPKTFQKPHQSLLLDIGCGAGYLLAHARAHGWMVRGVDPWTDLVDWAKKHQKLDIDCATWEQAAVEPDSADVITAFDVLSLAVDPVAFLRQCHKTLRPGGVLQISAWNQGGNPAGLAEFVIGAHQAAFTPETLSRAMLEAGFDAGQTECTTAGGPSGDLEIVVTARRAARPTIGWADIADEVDDAARPFLDRRTLDASSLTQHQACWRDNGYLILEKFIPEAIVDRYVAVRSKIADPLGWHSPSAYEGVEEMRDLALYAPLAHEMEQLIGKTMGLHLVLSGWTSTTRDWHQDDYLNPPEVNSHYIAVWFALDAISPDAGPFEFVPGSHRWPLVRRSKVMALLPPGAERNQSWPWLSEAMLSPFFDAEIGRRGVKIEQFLGNKGDVLLWHSNLLHRGSLPRNPKLERRSLIAHFTAVGHRNDMHATQRHKRGGTYFDLKADRPLGETNRPV